MTLNPDFELRRNRPMNILQILEAISNYLTEGFAMIFSAEKDELPEIGVQPFECMPYAQQK